MKIILRMRKRTRKRAKNMNIHKRDYETRERYDEQENRPSKENKHNKQKERNNI